MNLVFDVVIVSLSGYAYSKKKGILLMWITIAFCFFAASYVLTIIGLANPLVIVPLRAFGYLSVIAGVALHYIQRR